MLVRCFNCPIIGEVQGPKNNADIQIRVFLACVHIIIIWHVVRVSVGI